MATSIFERLAFQVGQKYLPKVGVPTAVNKYIPAIRNVLQGDFEGAANSLLTQLLGPMLGSSLEGTPLKLAGGITLTEARRMFEESFNTEYAKKNLWHISATNIGDGTAADINFFATDVGYSAHTVSGEAVRVGSSFYDKVDGTERVEMRLTTYDDAEGTIRRWFEDLRYKMARPDGTFGLPSEYLVRFTVTHATILEGTGSAYTDTFVMRPGSIETDLNRRDHAMVEIPMTFVQFDPFTNL